MPNNQKKKEKSCCNLHIPKNSGSSDMQTISLKETQIPLENDGRLLAKFLLLKVKLNTFLVQREVPIDRNLYCSGFAVSFSI